MIYHKIFVFLFFHFLQIFPISRDLDELLLLKVTPEFLRKMQLFFLKNRKEER